MREVFKVQTSDHVYRYCACLTDAVIVAEIALRNGLTVLITPEQVTREQYSTMDFARI